MVTPRLILLSSLPVVVLAVVILIGPFALGADLGDRSVILSNDQPAEVSDYGFSLTTATSANVGSISFTFCSNSPLPDVTCTASLGLSTASATLLSQTGSTGYSLASGQPVNSLLLTRVSSTSTPEQSTYTFGGLLNPGLAGEYFVKIATYSSSDGSGTPIDTGGLAYYILSPVTIDATVPPYLNFCSGTTITGDTCSTANGDFVDFGNLSPTTTKYGTTQLLAGSNATSGYAISIDGDTMTAGNDVIPEMDSDDVSRPGTAQFGINLKANVAPNVGSDPSGPGLGAPTSNYGTANQFKFTAGDVIATTVAPDNPRLYTVSYIVNVPKSQPPGVYVTTVTYICLAKF